MSATATRLLHRCTYRYDSFVVHCEPTGPRFARPEDRLTRSNLAAHLGAEG